MNPQQEDLAVLARYRAIYGLDERIGFEHVRAHEVLERRLTDALLASNATNRWEVFEGAYTRLYTELPWLNPPNVEEPPDNRIRAWRFLVRPGARVYEIGSGRARLLRFLRSIGAECVATEITRERGARHAGAVDGLTWRNSDGIHLTQFETRAAYDCIISTQVIEHMHPDDLPVHLQQARELLAPGGRYVFDTPHRSCGPSDLSQVFDLETARYMHLREYTWLELRDLLRAAGYSRIEAVFHVPGLAHHGVIGASWLYLQYMLMWDQLENLLGLSHRSRKRLRKALRAALLPSNVWLSATR